MENFFQSVERKELLVVFLYSLSTMICTSIAINLLIDRKKVQLEREVKELTRKIEKLLQEKRAWCQSLKESKELVMTEKNIDTTTVVKKVGLMRMVVMGVLLSALFSMILNSYNRVKDHFSGEEVN
jgi:hypothetical protein